MKAENTMTEDVERYDPQGPPLRRIALEHRARYRLACALAPGRRVLDLGCGEGYGTAAIASAGAERVVGVEVSLPAVARAQRSYGDSGASYVVGDACALPFADASFDLLVSFEVIEHVLRPNKLLQEARRSLDEHGVAVISTPNRLLTNEQSRYHLVEYSPPEFAELVGAVFPGAAVHGQHSLAVSVVGEDEAGLELEAADYLVAVSSPDVAAEAGRMAVRLAEVEHEFQGLLDHYVDLVARVDKDRQNLRGRLQDLEQSSAGIDEDRHNQQKLADERAEALARVEADRRNITQELSATKADRDNLRTIVEDAETDRTNLQHALSEVSADRDNLQHALSEIAADRDNLRDALGEITNDRDNLRNAVGDITNDRDNLRNALGEITNDRDNLKHALGEITNDRDNLREIFEQAQHDLEASEAEAQRLRETVDALGRDLEAVLESKGWRLLRALRIAKR